RNRTVPCELGEVKVRADLDAVELGVLWRDQRESVAQQIESRVVLDEPPLRAEVHPVEVGGGKHVGLRSLSDLLYECRTPGVGRDYLDAGALGIRRIYVVECVLHRRGGEDGDVPVLRRR